MLRYLLIRLLEGAVVIFGVVTIVFFVTRLLGDPVLLLVPQGASAADLASFREALGLDGPLYAQYFRFIADIFSGNLGNSFTQHKPALSVILERLPATLQLTGASMLIGAVFGGALGFLAAIYRDKSIASLIMLPAFFG
ncbi:MAG: ABC transporter permease [Rhizobiaceae bacterium]